MKLIEDDVKKPTPAKPLEFKSSKFNSDGTEVTWAELQRQARANKEFEGLDDDMTWGGNDQMIAVTSTPHYKVGMQIPKE